MDNFCYIKGKAINPSDSYVYIKNPLLSENEIKQALVSYSTVMVVALDICYSKLKNIYSILLSTYIREKYLHTYTHTYAYIHTYIHILTSTSAAYLSYDIKKL